MHVENSMKLYIKADQIRDGIRRMIAEDTVYLQHALHGEKMAVVRKFNLKKMPVCNPHAVTGETKHRARRNGRTNLPGYRDCGVYLTKRKLVRVVRSACKGTVGKVRKSGNKLIITILGSRVLEVAGGKLYGLYKVHVPFGRVRGDLHGTQV